MAAYYNNGYGFIGCIWQRRPGRWLWSVREHNRNRLIRCGAARSEQTAILKAMRFMHLQLKAKTKQDNAFTRILVHPNLER